MHAGELWWVLYEHKHLFAKKKKEKNKIKGAFMKI
jgi:hypothetical protein